MIIALLVGMALFYFLKSYGLIGIAAAAFVSGFVAKGPVNGLLVGLAISLIGAVIFVIPFPSPLELFGLAASVTGYTIADIDPLGLAISIFSITGVLAGTVAGFAGGLIRR